jgi:hypothetical protein
VSAVKRFVLHHHHGADECGVAFAAFKGHRSPLRHAPAVASCLVGDHTVWWIVDAPCAAEALEQLPYFVAQRTTATEVREVLIP